MSVKRVYYFTDKVLNKTVKMGNYYEIICIRMVGDDIRINQYYDKEFPKEFAHEIKYTCAKNSYDLEFEIDQLRNYNRLYKISNIKIIDASTEKELK